MTILLYQPGEASAGHPVGILTQLMAGRPGRRYGSFARTAHPVGILTQLHAGLPGQRYGSFAGKSAGPAFNAYIAIRPTTITGAF